MPGRAKLSLYKNIMKSISRAESIAYLKAEAAIHEGIVRNPRVHPKAVAELQRESHAEAVRAWLKERFLRLGIRLDDELVYRTNRYNETAGLGLQSVSVGVVGNRGLRGLLGRARSVRFKDEWQDPTIGIIAPGMLDVDPAAVATGIVVFPVDEGKAERLTALAGDLYLDDSGDFPTGSPQPLFRDHPLQITGPQIVRTLLEIKKADAYPARIRDTVHRGIYACEYLKTA